MVYSEHLKEALNDIVNNYDNANKNKLTYEITDEKGNNVFKNCTLEAAYAYKFVNAYGDNALNLVLVYDGWTDLLQKIAINGIHRGNCDNLGFDISIYTLDINDFDLDENSMLLYKDVMIILDNRGIFSSLSIQNDDNYTKYKKRVTI